MLGIPAERVGCFGMSHDDRVDIGGSQMLYYALKAQGSSVEFVFMKGRDMDTRV